MKAAKALISKDDLRVEVPIRLVVSSADPTPTSRIPERVILVIEENKSADTGEDSECACSDLNFHEKKVLEEYSYYTVVRTSEPSIIADVLEDEPEIDLQDIYGVPGFVPLSVFRKYHEIQRRGFGAKLLELKAENPDVQPRIAEGTVARIAEAPPAPAARSKMLDQDLLDRLLVDHKATIVIKGNRKPKFRGRTRLKPMNQID